MVCAPVRSIISSLKLGDYLSVQAHKPCSISHLFLNKFLITLFIRGGGGGGGGLHCPGTPTESRKSCFPLKKTAENMKLYLYI